MKRPNHERRATASGIAEGLRAVWLCIALAWPAAALAQSDRDETTPTGWWVIYDEATPEQVEDRIDLGFRLVDIEVVQASPLRFHAVFVRNEGVYQKNWWWYYGVTEPQLEGFLGTNNARLIDLEVYEVDGRLFFAAVMIENTGDDAAGWWWLYGQTFEELEAFVNATGVPPRRIIDLERYVFGGAARYAAVIIENTGVHAKPWWWYVNASPDAIGTNLSDNGARLVDLEPFGASGDSFMAVMVPHEGKHWWWWWGALDGDQIAEIAAQTGSRIIDLERYPTPDGNRYSAVFLNNSNELTTRVGDILREGTDGASGLYLKVVDGPVLGWLQADRVFEPASAIKVLHHAHALLRVQSNQVTLNTQLTVFLDTDGSCPLVPGSNSVNEPLSTVLQQMMVQSDNLRTQAVRTFFGEANINATAQLLGMTDTLLQHRIGCCRIGPDFGATSPNQFTLENAGLLYELAATSLFTPPVQQSFYDLMITSTTTGINTIITDEADAAGLTSDQREEFRGLFEYARKGGNYGCVDDGGSCCVFHRASCGWVSIPFRSRDGCDLRPREYVMGIFINDATDDSMAATTIGTAYAELLRDEIRAAAMSWLTDCTCPPPDCPADWSCDGGVNSNDISAFLTAWLASIQDGTLDADFNDDGMVDSNDISAFLTAWLQAVQEGC